MNHLEKHVMCLLKSFRHWTGKDLIPLNVPEEEWVKQVWESPRVIVSHGVENDPILNYGNQKALELWEMSWEEFVKTPSRLTAETVNQEERQRLLDRVSRFGYIDDYRGIRISHSGKRFVIEEAVVWNLLDEHQKYYGQAATFQKWRYL